MHRLISLRAVASAFLLALALVASPAVGADLGGGPRRGYEPPPEPIDIERWTGFYLGATAGFGWGSMGVDGTAGIGAFDQDGAMGSIFAGYNLQFGRAVLGVEADLGTGNLGGSGVGAYDLDADLNRFYSLRGRFGFLATPSLLLYGTGGFAWADYDLSINGAAKQTETFGGYQVGAGAEVAFAPHWTLRFEYIFTDLDSKDVSHLAGTDTFQPDFHTVRAGLSFKF